LALGLLLFHLGSGAATPAPLLSDFTHTAWNRLQGAPVDVLKITQTTDGWMWVATATGLYRFDGARFEKVDSVYGHRLDSSNVIGLTADGNNGLWVGYRLGGVTLFHPGGSRSFGEAEGLPTGGVIHIETASKGEVWVGTRDGVAWLAPGAKRFKVLGSEVGLPEKFVYQILLARDGTQWIASLQGLFFRKPGQQRFTQAWPRVTLLAVAEGADGTIWARDQQYQYVRVQTSAPADGLPVKREFPGMGMRFGSDRTMWVLHPDGVERRFGSNGVGYPNQRLTQNLGMSGPQAQCFFEDREGDIWIGTASGIDRMRSNRLRPLVLDKPMEEPGVALAPHASVVIGDRANPNIFRYAEHGLSRLAVKGSITASYRAANDTLYFGTDSAIYELQPDGRLLTTQAPPEVRGFYPQAMLLDRRGVLWVSFSSGPLFSLVGSQWARAADVERRASALTLAMASDDAGAIWLAHANNTVTIMDQAGRPARKLDSASGLEMGAVLQLTPDHGRMWLGGERGVMLYRDGVLVALRGQGGEQFKGVSGLVRTLGGDLWMHGAEGIYHIASDQMADWLAHPSHKPAFERFDAHDGLAGHAMQLRPIPSLLQADDGRLWFTTSSAVFVLDPGRMPRNRIIPPVLIRSVSSNDNKLPMPPDGQVSLPKGADNLHIEFTALALRMPDRIRFRYRLSGVDADWQGPTERREAFYTNLQPGSYRFEVSAANEDGAWQPSVASLRVELPPTFAQSIWFKLLLAAALLALLYAGHVLRMRVLTQRMQARLAERTRIARTLHDTLLQSIQGLILSFRAHSELVPPDARGRDRLDHTLKMAEQLLVEGRNEIMDLRSPPSSSALFDALAEFGHALTTMGTHKFEACLTGAARPLREGVYDEAYAIGRESLFNAVRYAEADLISLSIEYGRKEFNLVIRDNGKGLIVGEAVPHDAAGHWGMKGILERAKLIGADLQVCSEAGRGTSISLKIKKSLAYS
jgi:signal transduction histidine kinase